MYTYIYVYIYIYIYIHIYIYVYIYMYIYLSFLLFNHENGVRVPLVCTRLTNEHVAALAMPEKKSMGKFCIGRERIFHG